MTITYEVGDEVFQPLHKQKAIVLWVHPDGEKFLIEHTSEDKYTSLVGRLDICLIEDRKLDKNGKQIEEPIRDVVEMTVEEISEKLGKTVKVIE